MTVADARIAAADDLHERSKTQKQVGRSKVVVAAFVEDDDLYVIVVGLAGKAGWVIFEDGDILADRPLHSDQSGYVSETDWEEVEKVELGGGDGDGDDDFAVSDHVRRQEGVFVVEDRCLYYDKP